MKTLCLPNFTVYLKTEIEVIYVEENCPPQSQKRYFNKVGVFYFIVPFTKFKIRSQFSDQKQWHIRLYSST